MPAYVTSYAAAVLADSPAGYWRMSDANPVVLADSSGNGRDGTYQGGVTLGQPGALVDTDRAAFFDGATGAATVPDQAGLDLADVLTAEVWIRMGAAGGTGAILTKGANAFFLFVSAGTVIAGRDNIGNIVSSTVTLDDLAWHHVVWTKNAATNVLYVDGVDRSGAVTNLTLTDTAIALQIGRLAAGSFLRATLDEVALYPTALTAARVLAHFNAGRAIYAGARPRPSRAQLTAVLVADGVVGSPRRARYASYGAATAVPNAPTYGVDVVTEANAVLAEQRGRRVVSLTRFSAGAVIPPQYRRIAEAAAE